LSEVHCAAALTSNLAGKTGILAACVKPAAKRMVMRSVEKEAMFSDIIFRSFESTKQVSGL